MPLQPNNKTKIILWHVKEKVCVNNLEEKQTFTIGKVESSASDKNKGKETYNRDIICITEEQSSPAKIITWVRPLSLPPPRLLASGSRSQNQAPQEREHHTSHHDQLKLYLLHILSKKLWLQPDKIVKG